MGRRALCWLGLVLFSMSAWAPPAIAEEGEELTVHVLTFGPGEHPFLKFGHNAILVQPKAGIGWVFNFGTFDFADPELVVKFLRGRFHYWLSVGGADATLDIYRMENRTILAQELDLTSAQKADLWDALRINARPENRAYLYDYFYDNCSTRVRDAIDRVAGGRIREAGRAPGALTLRAHALRSVADYLPEYVGLYLGLARATDWPVDRWAESFLPERLAYLLRTVRLTDGVAERPLVKSERVLYQSTRPPKPVRPPRWAAYFFLVGLGVGATFLLLGRAAARWTAARVALGVTMALVGLVGGLLGWILLFLWGFTNHKVAHANANILQVAPWAVVLVAYGIGVARGSARAARAAAVIAVSAAISSALGIVAKALPGLSQDNWPFILACLPLWTGMWLGLRSLTRNRRGRAV